MKTSAASSPTRSWSRTSKNTTRPPKRIATSKPLWSKYRELKQVQQGIADATSMLTESDAELAAMAQEELTRLQSRGAELEEEIKVMLLPSDPNDEKNIILEWGRYRRRRSFAFCSEIFRMYSRFAESQRWRVEVLSTTPTPAAA